MSSRRLLSVWAIAIAVAVLVWAPRVNAGGNGSRVLSEREVQDETGRSIAQWGARWWQWAFDHPEVLGDTTGEFGELGDVRGPVFFAEGSGGDPVRASYDVPGGKYILLPVATYIWTFFDPCANVNCARRIINRNFIDRIIDVDVEIDGEHVSHMRNHVVPVDQAHPLVFKVDAGPIDSDGYGGIMNAVQGGYWVMLEPLSKGQHRISMSATVPNLDPFTGEVLPGYTDLDARLKLKVRNR